MEVLLYIFIYEKNSDDFLLKLIINIIYNTRQSSYILYICVCIIVFTKITIYLYVFNYIILSYFECIWLHLYDSKDVFFKFLIAGF